MIRTSTSIEIDRAADEVFAFVSEVTNNPRWQRGMQSCTWTSDPPLRTGSTYEQHARFLSKDIRNRFTVTGFEPGKRMSFESTEGSFPIAVTRTVEPLGPSRSRFTEEVEGEPKGFYRIAQPILRLLVKASIAPRLPPAARPSDADVIDGDLVVEEVYVECPPDELFDYFTDATKLTTWIGIGAQTEPVPGGVFRFEIAPGEFCEGAYVEVDRPTRVVFTWGWVNPSMSVPPGTSRVEIDLVPEREGTRVRLVHRDLPTDEARAMHAEGWSHFLAALASRP